MNLSVSGRMDIPSYYSDWFFERLKKGFGTLTEEDVIKEQKLCRNIVAYSEQFGEKGQI